VDQILAHPGDARLWEPSVIDANTYVRLAEESAGAIPRPVADDWPWGDALELLDRYGAEVRIANLETSITARGEAEPSKDVHYRMAPGNVGCLSAARMNALTLANNHVLDFGRPGLVETLETLAAAGIATAGAGRDADEAVAPAIVPTHSGGRVVLFGLGHASSGIHQQWAATQDRPGVWVTNLSRSAADQIVDRLRAVRQPGDTVVVSIHWGSNWGYELPDDHIAFARHLIEGGADIVHGHSSHHPRPVEVHRGKLILYGVGDLIDDYEGIGGYEEYRPNLRLLPIATVDAASGDLVALRLVPVQAHQLRLRRAPEYAETLCRTLNDISNAPPLVVTEDGLIELRSS
jgi:poly-gamma-glutamate capsule biosynthesis protein CapA/YwtB (metallophosphatase superfamily)